MTIHLTAGDWDADVEDEGAELIEGQHVIYWCQGCNRSFEWTAPADNTTPPSYHSKNCQRRTKEAVKKGRLFPCPTPAKKRYRSPESAQQALNDHRRTKDNVKTTMYLCRCGVYHLGHVTYFVVGKDTDDD